MKGQLTKSCFNKDCPEQKGGRCTVGDSPQEKNCDRCGQSDKNHPLACSRCNREAANESPQDRSVLTTKPDWEERFIKEFEFTFYLKEPTYGEENRRNMEHVKSFIRQVRSEGVQEGIEMAVGKIPKKEANQEVSEYYSGYNQAISDILDALKEIQK